jgi:hypothetical protein
MNIQLKASAPVGALPRIESNAEDLRIVEGGPVAESGLKRLRVRDPKHHPSMPDWPGYPARSVPATNASSLLQALIAKSA